MAADRARISYFRPRKYREVVSQQGRVLLEADLNNGQRIFTEEVRQEALDFVGPCGTPDNGYEVTPLANFDFQIGAGTMYVGGVRTTLEKPIRYSSQPDWLDVATPQPWSDDLWKPLAALRRDGGHVLLVLREQEITSVEDPAMLEKALGGPDSAAFTRMLQRIVVADTDAKTCALAKNDVGKFWSARGLNYDPDSARLQPRARLRVTLVTDPPSANPCDPPAASGYLGADNQLIRVMISAFDPATNKGKLLWAYNNASTLYRCQALDDKTLKLATRPVSAEFQPRANQVVQLLLPAADLDEGAYAAALTGYTAKLLAPYNPDTQLLTLPANIPAVDKLPAPPPPLYLRLWEDEIDFTLNAPATLTGVGLQVTISGTEAGMLHLGDHWSIAARPLTPNAVYPERYLTSPQPPDGPRMWACSLAVIRPSGESFTVDDCRLPFDNLPELTARKSGTCCCVTVNPKQGKDLQKILDQAVAAAQGSSVSVLLEAGVYRLPRPLVLTSKHKGLTIASCSGGAVVLRPASRDPLFAHGMIQALGVEDVRLNGLDFQVTPVPLPDELQKTFELVFRSDLSKLEWTPRMAAIGVRAIGCFSLKIEFCNFHFVPDSPAFAAALMIQGDNGGIETIGCQFAGDLRETDSVFLGIALAPLLTLSDNRPRTNPSSVEDLQIDDCLFAAITAGIVLTSRPLYVSVENCIARDVHTALLILTFDDKVKRPKDLIALLEASAKSPTAKALVPLVEADRWTILSFSSLLLWQLPKGGDQTETAKRSRVYTLGGAALDKVPGAAVPQGLGLTLRGNQFDARPLDGDNQASGSAVLVWDLSSAALTANASANTLWNSSLLPAMAVISIPAFNITGNVIANRFLLRGQMIALSTAATREAPALWVQPITIRDNVDLFTVTGNSLVGATNLDAFPRREWVARLPGGMSELLTWEFFNTIV